MNSELIYRYLNGDASEVEIQQLFDWIDASEKNKKEFIALKKTWAFTAQDLSSQRTSWNIIKKGIHSPALAPAKRFHVWKYAAVILFIVGLGATLHFWNTTEIPGDTNGIVLETGEEHQEILLPQGEKIIKDASGVVIAEQNNNVITYHPRTEKKELVYHSIKIPNGEKFKVQLSDGSLIHLNSGSKLKFPQQFIGNSREIFLEGEAYFEVAHNPEMPFIVNAKAIDITVLGTKFNVSAYPEDKFINTVLVEGSVQLEDLESRSNQVLLTPNHLASWNTSEKFFTTEPVDPQAYLAWMRGELIFHEALCPEIFQKLERKYNVDIVNKNDVLSRQTYTGTFDVEEISIEEILDLLRIDTPFNYTRNGSTITITTPETN